MARLHRARIEVDAEIRNREPVLAVGGKVVPELHPAARAQRQAVDVERLIAGFAAGRRWRSRPWAGFAHGQPRRQPRGGDVLIEERGRDAQRRGDVVEAVDFDLGRQQLLGVELDAQQIVDRGSELGARQALHRHVAGHRGRRRRHRASPPSRSRTRRSRADPAGGCRAAASAGRAACARRLPRRRRARAPRPGSGCRAPRRRPWPASCGSRRSRYRASCAPARGRRLPAAPAPSTAVVRAATATPMQMARFMGAADRLAAINPGFIFGTACGWHRSEPDIA